MANWEDDDGDFGNEEEPVPELSKYVCCALVLFVVVVSASIYLLLFFNLWR